MARTRTVGWSFARGLTISLAIGAPLGAVVYYALQWWLWTPLATTASVATWLSCAYGLLIAGYGNIRIPIGAKGVNVRGGNQPTGIILESGDHFAFFAEGAIPVDTRHVRVDLSNGFTATAANTNPVGVDAFLLGHVASPARWLGVDNPAASLREVLESRIRLFTSVVKGADSAIQFKDRLADYLELEPRTTDAYTPSHQRVYDALCALAPKYIAGGTKSVEDLLDKDTAGSLKKIAGEWGFVVEQVEVEEFGLPPEIKAAYVRKSAAKAEMAAEKIENAARAQMVKKLVDAGVNPDAAMTAVNMQLGMPVTETIQKWTVTDLDKVAASLGSPVAALLANLLMRGQGSNNGSRTGGGTP